MQKSKDINVDVLEKIQIDSYIEKGNYAFALKCYQEYLKKYPRDFSGMRNYGQLLRFLKNTEFAREVLEYAISKTNDTMTLIYLHWELIFLFIDEKNYSVAYEHFLKYEELMKFYPSSFDKDAFLLSYFLKKQLGIYMPYARRKDYDYFERQIIEYQKKDLFSFEKSFSYTFSVGIYALHEDLQKILPNSIQTPNYSIFDTYWFSIPNIGIEKAKALSNLKVWVLPSEENTFPIVKIVPYETHKSKLYLNDFESLKMDYEITRKRVKVFRRKVLKYKES